MARAQPANQFRWLDRGFWGLWVCFPFYAWVLARDVIHQASDMAALAPEQAACLQDRPQVTAFSSVGQVIFWTVFVLHLAFFAALLALAHRVIHGCATGRMFVLPLIRTLRTIGIITTLYPVADLVVSNLTMAAYVATGDLNAFLPDFAFDVTVFGVGLLLLTMAMAMRQAMALHRDAELTI